MRKVFAVHCPKEEDKRYFSKAIHKYKNNITVKFNDEVLFDNIDDAEENLPINKHTVLDIMEEVPSTISLDYDIKIGDVSEQSTVEFVLDPLVEMVHTKIHRKNFVEGTEKLSDDYIVTLTVNEHEQTFGKDFHTGATKTLKFSLPVDVKDVINIKLESKKVFQNDPMVTYDTIELIFV